MLKLALDWVDGVLEDAEREDRYAIIVSHA